MIRIGRYIIDPQFIGIDNAQRKAREDFYAGRPYSPPVSPLDVDMPGEFYQLLPLFVEAYHAEWEGVNTHTQ